ncbi:hypothetical protein BV25DRAFT_1325805 [Artomyces pyxidatus]|uniref:Uncharacterized protein n=1 Tax=Artomyces pyxidatus TaxID=48021 RepID=A0ACB8SNC5_9AGAM|nr:hypothetical protein BV25DRAFT_1325805 [Artomyces pyxidatus]
MDDSDDYFDDIILDDEAIAALDATESQFLAAETQHTRPAVDLPPAKRQKTAQGWNAPQKKGTGFSLEDDMPEISIRNGFYGVPGHSHSQSASQQSRLPPSHPPSQNMMATSSQNAVAGPSTVSQPRKTTPAPAQRPPPSHTITHRPPLANRPTLQRVPSRGVSTPVPSQRQGMTRHPSNNNLNGRQGPAPLQRHPTSRLNLSQAIDTARLQDEVTALRVELEMLRKANVQTQSSLNEALEEKRAKVGEAAILRHNYDKAVEMHRLEEAKLRSAKEKLEAAQAEMHQKQQQELELLRTQLVFKKHEYETSTHKSALAVHSSVRKAGGDFPSTQAPMSSQIRRWNQPDAGPSRHTKRSPIRMAPLVAPHSPRSQRKAKPVPPAPPAKKNAALPGFVNAFASASPRPPVSRYQDKGKGKERVSFLETSQWDIDNNALPPPSPPSSPTRPRKPSQKIRPAAMEIDQPEIADMSVDPEVSISMDVDAETDAVPLVAPMTPYLVEEFEDLEPQDWVGRLQQIVFTHTMPPTNANSLQILLSASFPSSDDAVAYSRACSKVLDVLGTSTPASDFELVARTVAAAFAQMAYLLHSQNLIKPLPALLSLLTVLTVSLPYFVLNLLTPQDRFSKRSPAILSTIGGIIPSHLTPAKVAAKDPDKAVYTELAQEVFHLLDVISFFIPPDLETQLSVVPLAPNVMSTLVDSAHPTWFLRDSMRSLSMLATRASIFRSLLSFPEDTPEEAKNFRKLPQIQNICRLLLDGTRTGTEANAMSTYALVTFVQLAMADPDGVMILSESEDIIPSLVKFLTMHSTSLWEEDELLMGSPSLLSETVSAIAHGLLLLHYLVFHSEPPLSLRQKLQHASHRQFNGIGHMFAVTFGRLSYAEPPDQVSPDDKLKLEQLAEPARDLMELVVEGPESESIWAAFQGDPQPTDGADEDDVDV